MASPRSVTGASTRQCPARFAPPSWCSGPRTCTCWMRIACSSGPPSKGTTVADSSPSRRSPGARGGRLPAWGRSGTWASRTSARPDRSAIRKDTSDASRARPSSRVADSTASTGEAASAASITLPRALAPPTCTMSRSIGPAPASAVETAPLRARLLALAAQHPELPRRAKSEILDKGRSIQKV